MGGGLLVIIMESNNFVIFVSFLFYEKYCKSSIIIIISTVGALSRLVTGDNRPTAVRPLIALSVLSHSMVS